MTTAIKPIQQLTDKQLLDALRTERQADHEPTLLRHREQLISESKTAVKEATRQLGELVKQRTKAAAALEVARRAAHEAALEYNGIDLEILRVEQQRDAAEYRTFYGLTTSADRRLHDAITKLKSLASRSEMWVTTYTTLGHRGWPQQIAQKELNRQDVRAVRDVLESIQHRLERLVLAVIARADITAELLAAEREANLALKQYQVEPLKFVSDEERANEG